MEKVGAYSCDGVVKEEKIMDNQLTKEETEMLLNIAIRNGCDVDGDILLFYVSVKEEIVKLR